LQGLIRYLTAELAAAFQRNERLEAEVAELRVRLAAKR